MTGFQEVGTSRPVFCELAATSNFSFLRGASHPEELVGEAAALGLDGIAIADRNTIAGVVRGHMAAKEAGIAYAPGCRLAFMDGTPEILVWPENRAAYGNLCELLTRGKRRAPKGACHLALEDLMELGTGLQMAVIPPHRVGRTFRECLRTLRSRFAGSLHVALVRHHGPEDERRMARIARIAGGCMVPLVAIGDVLYHTPMRRPLQDVLTCVREHETLATIGRRLQPNAERHLRSPSEIRALFEGYEEAVDRAGTLFRRLGFSLDELRHQYPDDPVFEELGGQPMTSQTTLERLAALGLERRYPEGAPDRILRLLKHEKQLIARLGYAPYFLTVYDIVRYARSQGILCQGRGSAANSVVCFVLGITEVDPEKVDLLFERFISEERNEPPDIDVDFEHERREEVIQYIYAKYGRERAGLAATVISYRARSAIRDTGKVFGLSEDAIAALSGTRWGSSSREIGLKDVQRAGFDPADKHLRQMLDLADQLTGFPRHLSQHVGGFVITRDRLSSLVPIENAAMADRTLVEWDKDDLDNLGLLKIDVLALGMLTCLRKAFSLLARHYDRHETLASLPADDRDTYDMICRADTIGVFQIESRAQMSMLPRLKPRTYYDLVIEVAIVRPGPIQGDMVHPYLRRRQGLEPVTFPKEEMRKVLGKTLGVPLFQEQAMNIAIVAANFQPGEADRLRRAMATFRRVGTIGTFRDKMVEGMVRNGYERDFAEHCFRQIEGFGEYGFPESHAASFALLVYVSCWLKCHYPDVFCAALLNSQPMGFYAPAQIVRDAREHGVEIRPVDINHSDWCSTLEPNGKGGPLSPQHRAMNDAIQTNHAVRLGLHRVKGLAEHDAQTLVQRRGRGYDSIRDLWLRSELSRSAIERLAEADCFRSIGLDRRDALWAVKALDPLGSADRLPLFAAAENSGLQYEPDVKLPPMPLGEHVINDYQTLSLSLKAHPVSFIRERLFGSRFIPCVSLQQRKTGQWGRVAGLVLVRQRPGSARGVIFATIEDETGVANIIVWPKVFEKYRAVVLGSRCIGVTGRIQNEEGVIHIVANHLEDMTPMLAEISTLATRIDALANADEVRHPIPESRTPVRPGTRMGRLVKDVPELRPDLEKLSRTRTAKMAMPKGRNFH